MIDDYGHRRDAKSAPCVECGRRTGMQRHTRPRSTTPIVEPACAWHCVHRDAVHPFDTKATL